MPDYDEMEPSGENRHAFEWGLASLLMGCFLALGAPVTLIFNVMILVAGQRAIPPQFAGLLFWIGILATVILVVSCLLAFSFGVKAARSASATGHPAGLATAGILASLLALGLWIFVGIDLIMILGGAAGVRL
jgi:hypothetical protein